MAVLVIVGLAIGLQVITAIAVRRLIQVAGRPWGWVSWAARKQAEEALSIRIEQMQAVHTIAEAYSFSLISSQGKA